MGHDSASAPHLCLFVCSIAFQAHPIVTIYTFLFALMILIGGKTHGSQPTGVSTPAQGSSAISGVQTLRGDDETGEDIQWKGAF
jgi:hypothetical protein